MPSSMPQETGMDTPLGEAIGSVIRIAKSTSVACGIRSETPVRLLLGSLQ